MTETRKAQRMMIYDATQDDLRKKYLSQIWSAGSLLGKFDYVVPVRSVADFIISIKQLKVDSLKHIQVWSHGSPGCVWIGEECILPVDLADAFRSIYTGEADIWFRSCNVFTGRLGKAFAKDVLAYMNVASVVGHTRVVSAPFFTHQSGGYALRLGETPHWSSDDSGGSYPWAPNTCLVTRMNPPISWYQDPQPTR